MNHGYDLAFFETWEQKTEQEKTYFELLLVALDEIKNKVAQNDLVSIYIFGSFPHRKLRPSSDIDLRLILRDSYLYVNAISLKESIFKKTDSKVNMGYYYESEVEQGWFLNDDRKGCRTPPNHFFKYPESIISIYGKRPNQYNAPLVSDYEEIFWFCNRIRGFFDGTDYDGLNRNWSKQTQLDEIVKQLRMLHDVQKRLDLNSSKYFKISMFLKKKGLLVGANNCVGKLEQIVLSDIFWVRFKEKTNAYLISIERAL